MAAKKKKGTVLILDDDLGFAMWLGGALHEAGFRALPANTSEQALAISERMRPPAVDVLIANLAISAAGDVIDKLVSTNKSLKIVAIGAPAGRKVDARISRPRGKTLPSPQRYVQTVERVLNAEPG